MKKTASLISLLIGIAVSVFSQNSTLTIREVFDFQPGDIFHSKVTPLNPAPPAAKRFEVLTRNTSPGNDTICYTFRHFDYTSEVGLNFTFIYKHHNYLRDVCYTNLDSMVHTLIDTPWITYPFNTFADSTFNNPLLCDSLTYIYSARYGHYFEPTIVLTAYSKGLGVTEHLYNYNYSMPPTHHRWRVVYYKKGQFDCGQPDTVSTGIAHAGTAQGNIISYPNPVSSHLNIEFDETMARNDMDISLLNLFGQVVIHKKIAGGANFYSVNMNELPPGIYILQVAGKGFPAVSQKIIKGD